MLTNVTKTIKTKFYKTNKQGKTPLKKGFFLYACKGFPSLGIIKDQKTSSNTRSQLDVFLEKENKLIFSLIEKPDQTFLAP